MVVIDVHDLHVGLTNHAQTRARLKQFLVLGMADVVIDPQIATGATPCRVSVATELACSEAIPVLDDLTAVARTRNERKSPTRPSSIALAGVEAIQAIGVQSVLVPWLLGKQARELYDQAPRASLLCHPVDQLDGVQRWPGFHQFTLGIDVTGLVGLLALPVKLPMMLFSGLPPENMFVMLNRSRRTSLKRLLTTSVTDSWELYLPRL